MLMVCILLLFCAHYLFALWFLDKYFPSIINYIRFSCKICSTVEGMSGIPNELGMRTGVEVMDGERVNSRLNVRQ